MKKSNEQLFPVKDPFGRTITLEGSAYAHIIEGHPIMEYNMVAVSDTVKNPDKVYSSKTHPERREEFYKAAASAGYKAPYTKVIVEKGDNGSGTIVTAFPSKKEGGTGDQELLYSKDEL